MFSIYGETGRIYKGPMEDMWRIDAVRRVARTRAVGAQRSVSQATPLGHETPVAPVPHIPHNPLAAYQQAGADLASRRHPLSRVQDVMSRGVFTVPVDATVMHAWQQLAEHGIGQAPVVDASGVLVGLLSRADLLRPDRLPSPDSSSLAWRALLAQTVGSVMWSPVPAVDPQTDLRRVARVLLDTHLPGLPVADEEGRVAGFISRTDILRAVVHDPPLDLWS